MREIMRRLWRPSLRMGVIVSFVSGALSAAEAETEGLRLLSATRAVDRVVVIPSNGDGGSGLDDERVLFEIKGRETIADLARVMEFEPPEDGLQMPCLCYGTHRIEFYAGENFKFSLSYHHWNRLRGDMGGPWWGDAVLTDKGRDQTIAWFAERGFAEFQAQMRQSEEWQKEREQRRASIAALFPEEARAWLPAIDHNRSWSKEMPVRSEALAGLYTDKADLLLTVWRALGVMREWPENRSLTVFGEPGGFLCEVAKKVSSEDYARALARVPEHESAIWLGACRHMVSEYRQLSANWNAWEVRLADFYLGHATAEERRQLVDFLYSLKSADADSRLLKLGETAEALADADPRSDVSWRKSAPTGITALSLLAERRVPAAREVIDQKLMTAPAGEDRLVLEIARACYDAVPAIRSEHLSCNRDGGDAAELAWKLYSESPDKREDIELLAAAARSPSYAVKKQAAARLAAYGLRMDANNVVESLVAGIQGTTVQVIEKCTALLENETNLETQDAVRKRRGFAYLEIGDYAAARKDLRYAGESAAYSRAFVAYALGRYGEALDIVFRPASDKDDVTKLLMLRACLRFSMGEFEAAADDITAASVLGASGFDADAAVVFRHLMLMRLGRAEHSPLIQWEVPSIGDEFFGEPNELILFLQGKSTEETMLKAMETDDPEGPAKICQASWVLAELALFRAETDVARRYLERAVSVKVFESLWHVLALRRLVELDESVGTAGR